MVVIILGSCSLAQLFKAGEQSKYTIEVISAPAAAVVNAPQMIKWQVKGDPKNAEQTAIYYDNVAHAGNFGSSVSPLLGGYPKFSIQESQGEIKMPGTFSAVITSDQSGILYYRAMAKIEEQYYWTPEYTIAISAGNSALP